MIGQFILKPPLIKPLAILLDFKKQEKRYKPKYSRYFEKHTKSMSNDKSLESTFLGEFNQNEKHSSKLILKAKIEYIFRTKVILTSSE